MQHTLIHIEHAKAIAVDRERGTATAVPRMSHPPPMAPRRHLAGLLARIAWRLDREAALRAWP